MHEAAPIVLRGVNHFYGEGPLRRQILHDISVEIDAGQIVIVTGPSGSGKTTLLMLVGALRSPQEGSVRVLDRELRGARTDVLEEVRTRIGYVFQAHNLLDALTAQQNVMMSLLLHPGVPQREARARAAEALSTVSLADKLEVRPARLSGGQRQRVAIARALAHGPRIILADEPTASLDKKSGRDVADLIRRLAREHRVTVLLVTHDNRILDIADRILHLEDGRLQSLTDAVLLSTQLMMGTLADHKRKGGIDRQLEGMTDDDFLAWLDEATAESKRFLEVTRLAQSDAFESMLEQVLRAATFRFARMAQVERASLFLVDPERRDLLIKVAREEGGRPLEARLPMDRGIAGHVATSGRSLRVDDAYAHPLFNREVDQQTGFRTRTILCVPIRNASGEVFAVAQLLNRIDGRLFDAADEERFGDFVASIGVVLESWLEMQARREVA